MGRLHPSENYVNFSMKQMLGMFASTSVQRDAGIIARI
jgi:hypothetical protein